MEFLSGRKKLKLLQFGFVLSLTVIPILHFLVFYVGINWNSLLLAFKKPTGEFTLDNFKLFFDQLGRNGSNLSLSLVNTLKFFLLSVVLFPLSITFTFFLFKKIPMYKYFRVVFFLPSIISGAVLTTLYRNILNGPVADLVAELFNMKYAPLFFNSTEYALKSIMSYQVWLSLGGQMILVGSTMSRIPTEVLESGKIDGVGFFGELGHFILPMIWPTLSTLILMMCIGIFGASGPILLFTQGMYGTSTLSYFIYELSAIRLDYNFAAAVGLFFTACGLPIIFIVKWIMSKLDQDIEY